MPIRRPFPRLAAAFALVAAYGCGAPAGAPDAARPHAIFGIDQRTALDADDPLAVYVGLVRGTPTSAPCSGVVVGPKLVATTARCAGLRGGQLDPALGASFSPDAARDGHDRGRKIAVVDLVATGAPAQGDPTPMQDWAVVVLAEHPVAPIGSTQTPYLGLYNGWGLGARAATLALADDAPGVARGRIAAVVTPRCTIRLAQTGSPTLSDCDAHQLALGGALISSATDAPVVGGIIVAVGAEADGSDYTHASATQVVRESAFAEAVRRYIAGDQPGVEDPAVAARAAAFARLCADPSQPEDVRDTFKAIVRAYQITDCGQIAAKMAPLKELSLGYYFDRDRFGVRSLVPFKVLTGLRKIDISYQPITDLSPLGELPDLESLHLTQLPELADLSGLARATKLKSLHIGNLKRVASLAPVASLKNLETASFYEPLDSRDLTDLEFLADLPKLKVLRLDDTGLKELTTWLPRSLEELYLESAWDITDVRAIATLTNLRILKLEAIKSIPALPVGALTKLEDFELTSNYGTPTGAYQNAVSDLSGFRDLKALRRVIMVGLKATDITALGGKPALKELSLSWMQVRDLTPLFDLTALEKLSLYMTEASDVRPLQDLPNLVELALPNNKIENVAPLARLTTLRTLNLASNRVRDPSPLAALTSLTRLDLRAQETPLTTRVCPVQDPFDRVCIWE